eukprot:1141749-Pelagomonas_calceolata.AAC.5
MPAPGPGPEGGLGTSQSTCRPFQLAAEPTDLHGSSCNGNFSSCSNKCAIRSMDRGVSMQKFADTLRSRTCTPALVYG